MSAPKFSATIAGFVSEEAALTFIKWYEGGGEQSFYDWIDCQAVPGVKALVDMSYVGNTGKYYDETRSEDGSVNYTAYVK